MPEFNLSIGARFRTVAAAAVLVALTLATFVLAQPPPDSYALPGERVFPEGIAVDAGAGLFYTGSTGDGTIYRGDIASGEVTVLVEGGAPPFSTIGMDIDGSGRLWVAGGGSGALRVYDASDGTLLATLATEAAPATFINDVVVVGEFAYATDSNRPLLFRAPLDLSGVEAWLSFEGTAFAYIGGFNANGIAASNDGAYLLVVQTNTGSLYRIDIAAGELLEVAIEEGGESTNLPGGDGLTLVGTTLYVVGNGEVVVVELADDLTRGAVTRHLGDPRFVSPTTADAVDDGILVVNSQFNNLQGQPQLPFTVVRVPTP
jgi:Cu-Zn family superoxide dismutase